MDYQKYMKRRLIMVSERNVDDSQSSIASGTPQYFSETSQCDHEMFPNDQLGYRQNVDQLDDVFNQMSVDVMINPDSDPMFSNHDETLESFHNFP